MTVNAAYPSRPAYPVLRWIGSATFVFFALSLVYMLVAALIYGPQARAAAERHTAIVMEQEDRAFCTGLGHNPTSEIYARCTAGLADVRRWHEERLTADTGIL